MKRSDSYQKMTANRPKVTDIIKRLTKKMSDKMSDKTSPCLKNLIQNFNNFKPDNKMP